MDAFCKGSLEGKREHDLCVKYPGFCRTAHHRVAAKMSTWGGNELYSVYSLSYPDFFLRNCFPTLLPAPEPPKPLDLAAHVNQLITHGFLKFNLFQQIVSSSII